MICNFRNSTKFVFDKGRAQIVNDSEINKTSTTKINLLKSCDFLKLKINIHHKLIVEAKKENIKICLNWK